MVVQRKDSNLAESPITIAGINLADAIRLIRQAGHSDPTEERGDDRTVLQHVIGLLCELSLNDGLTGLMNARHFRATLDREVDRASRTGEPCALLMVDVDHFKTVNDTYGHPAGDVVLQAIAQRLKENLRPMDTVARYGGEEFALILPNTLPTSLPKIAERVRSRIAGHPFELGTGELIQATVSIGGACSLPWLSGKAGALLEEADRQLYKAKTSGRNRVSCDIPSVPAVTGNERAALYKRSRKP
jgi:diguanylate cyclase (GGDEF)-like protein